jgi:hypothetical protein
MAVQSVQLRQEASSLQRKIGAKVLKFWQRELEAWVAGFYCRSTEVDGFLHDGCSSSFYDVELIRIPSPEVYQMIRF